MTASATARTTAVDGFIAADSDNIGLFPQQVIDNLMHALIAMGGEVWTTRRRLLVLERVLEKAGISSDDIERFVVSPEDQAAWTQERDIFITRTFGALTRQGGANDLQLDRAS